MAGGCLCVAFVSRRLASLFLIRIIITRLTVCLWVRRTVQVGSLERPTHSGTHTRAIDGGCRKLLRKPDGGQDWPFENLDICGDFLGLGPESIPCHFGQTLTLCTSINSHRRPVSIQHAPSSKWWNMFSDCQDWWTWSHLKVSFTAVPLSTYDCECSSKWLTCSSSFNWIGTIIEVTAVLRT